MLSDTNPNKLTRETFRKSARGKEVHKAKDANDQLGILGGVENATLPATKARKSKS